MNNKIPFKITASAQDRTALIRITGTLGWDIDCELFRSQIDGIANQGITDAHLYLHGPGGSCFDAEEIVNIIKSVFTGKVTGEGGALVASAYTRIAMICETFTMPENGMFMLHKPAGGISGTANDIASYLKLLTDIESQYFNIYKTRATDAATFEAQWNAGDWWMTAKEAEANGFLTSVKAQAKMDAKTTALISACGCPESKIPTINNKIDEMDLKATAKTLGLSENATEAEVSAALVAAQKAQSELQALQLANKQKEQNEKSANIKAALDTAQLTNKTINGDTRTNWEILLNADYENGLKALTGLQPVKKLETITGKGATATSGKVTHEGKTFEEMQDESPELLEALQSDDPQAFDELYNNYLTRNKLK